MSPRKEEECLVCVCVYVYVCVCVYVCESVFNEGREESRMEEKLGAQLL